MIIKTRKLAPTQTEGPRMRATVVSDGTWATLTVAYPYGEDAPHRQVAHMLATALGYGDVTHEQGNVYRAEPRTEA